MSDESVIQNVSDTALWVAYYRAQETLRSDALFQDPLAKELIGNRGEKIAQSMKLTSRYSEWSVIIRTLVIDQLIQKLVREDVDTVVNLGAGMDTRPYRLDLPSTLRWVEIDYPHTIQYKEKILEKQKPRINVERIALDLANRQKRQEIFTHINAQSKKTLILTEGVIIYLTEEQVATLGEDLHDQNHFHFWIAEYFSPKIYPYFKTRERVKQLKNAPFQFFPKDWFAFFKDTGWQPQEIRYLAQESFKVKRPMPMPWWGYVVAPFLSKQKIDLYTQQMGYVVFTKI